MAIKCSSLSGGMDCVLNPAREAYRPLKWPGR